jgi:uncharacterized protein YifN (PemK superfamily)
VHRNNPKYLARLIERDLQFRGEQLAITFAPRRGAILLCDFDMACVPPEMNKRRQVIVVSRREMNHRHAKAAGLCTVVPVSATQPASLGPEDVFLPAGRYWSFSRDSWIKCRVLCTLSHDRLDLLLRFGRRHPSEFLLDDDMAKVETAIRTVLSVP